MNDRACRCQGKSSLKKTFSRCLPLVNCARGRVLLSFYQKFFAVLLLSGLFFETRAVRFSLGSGYWQAGASPALVVEAGARARHPLAGGELFWQLQLPLLLKTNGGLLLPAIYSRGQWGQLAPLAQRPYWPLYLTDLHWQNSQLALGLRPAALRQQGLGLLVEGNPFHIPGLPAAGQLFAETAGWGLYASPWPEAGFFLATGQGRPWASSSLLLLQSLQASAMALLDRNFQGQPALGAGLELESALWKKHFTSVNLFLAVDALARQQKMTEGRLAAGLSLSGLWRQIGAGLIWQSHGHAGGPLLSALYASRRLLPAGLQSPGLQPGLLFFWSPRPGHNGFRLEAEGYFQNPRLSLRASYLVQGPQSGFEISYIRENIISLSQLDRMHNSDSYLALALHSTLEDFLQLHWESRLSAASWNSQISVSLLFP